jgi:hypothetical protein
MDSESLEGGHEMKKIEVVAVDISALAAFICLTIEMPAYSM